MRGLAWLPKPGWKRTRALRVGGLWLLFIFIFYFWRLGSLTAGLGPREYLSRQNSQSLSSILEQGINAPYYLVQHLAEKIHTGGVLSLRLTSVFFGLIILAYLLSLLKSWFGKSMALFGGLVFLTSPWLVLTIRSAGPDIMLLWPIVMLACFMRLLRSKEGAEFAWLLLCAAVAISLYTPGLIWLSLAAVAANWRRLQAIKPQIKNLYAVAGILGALVILSPLVLSIIGEPSRAKDLFLIPSKWPHGIEITKSILWSLAALFWQTRTHLDIGLGRLPLLNILQISLGVFGIYALGVRSRRITYYLIGLLLFAVLGAGINENPHLLLLGLPPVAIFVTAGLRYLMLEWRRVFPLNPIAKSLAILLISATVAIQVLYCGRYVLVAWPHSDATKTTYVLK